MNVKRVVALTATAIPQVERDICEKFEIQQNNSVRTPFFRSNLKFTFTPCRSTKESDAKLLQALLSQSPPGATIVYAMVQKTTEIVTCNLRNAGIDAKHYHAGMKQEDRKNTQDWFMEDVKPGSKPRVVVATIAFGMGVDKSNIRYVYHYNLPKSLESYAQEIGRAGRDGKDSYCEVLCCLDDVAQLESFAYCGSPSKRSIKGVLKDIFLDAHGRPYSQGVQRNVSHYSLAKSHDLQITTVQMLLSFIDIYQDLLQQGTPRYGMYKIKSHNSHISTIHSILGSCGDSTIASVLRRVCQVKKIWAHIDIGNASQFASRNALTNALTNLEQRKLIEVMPSQVEHVYTLRKKVNELDTIVEREYERFQNREKRELSRVGEVLSFFTAGTCQAQLLTEHFEGRDGPSTKDENKKQTHQSFPCGFCPFCKSGYALKLNNVRKDFTIDPNLWKKLVSDPKVPHDDPHLIARFALGFKSPRITFTGLSKSENFGLMEGAPYAKIMAYIMENMFSQN